MPIASFFRTAWRPFFAALLAGSTLAFTQTPSAADGFDPNADGNVYALATQPDGKIIVAGQFSALRPNGTTGATRNNLARINADGSLDATFNPNANGPVRALVLQGDGKIIIGGDFTTLQPNGAATATNRSCLARLNADGSLDPTFVPQVTGAPLNQVYALVQMADGTLYVGGNFLTASPTAAGGSLTRHHLAKFNAAGIVDGRYDPEPDALVFALAPHIDGKLLVAGGFNSFLPNDATDRTTRNRIARLNPDGTPDSEFDPKADNRITALAVQRDGKILIGGDFGALQPNGASTATAHNRFARLNVDGTLDTTFSANTSGNVAAISVLADGSILVGGSFTTAWSGAIAPTGRPYLAHFLPDGTFDSNFSAGPNSSIDCIAPQPDGRVIIGGHFTGLQPPGAIATTVRGHLARITLTGALDATFDLDAGGRPLVEAVQKDGKILIGGSFTTVGGVTHNHLARLNPDGSVDATFKPDFNGLVLAMAVQPADQKILVGGTFTTIGGETRNFIARLNPSGTIDSEFNPNANAQVGAIALQPDGKILLGGSFTGLQPIGATDPRTRSYVARLNADGTLDTAFHPNTNNTVNSIVVQPDGKILLGGTFTNVTPEADLTITTKTAPTVATDKAGTTSTKTGNVTTTTVVSITDNVTTTTTSSTSPSTTRSGMARFNADGTLDTTFDPNLNAGVNALVLQPDGKIVAGGTFSLVRPNGSLENVARNRLARFNADGTLDATFDPNANSAVLTLALQADGKILVGGPFTTLNPGTSSKVNAPNYTLRKYAARLNPDGTVDATFNLDLNELTGNRVDSWLVLSDGRILVGGNFLSMQPAGSTAGRVLRPRFARLTAAGQLDTTFQPGVGGTPTAQINTLAFQANGKLVVAGSFADLGGTSTANLARFNPEGTPDFTFAPAPGADGPINTVLVRADTAPTVPQGTGIAVLNPNGSVRTTFAPPADARLNGTVSAVAVQPDGSVLVGGAFDLPSSIPGPNLVRYLPNGTIDANFGPSPNGPVDAITLQPDGKILIAGGFTNVAGGNRNYVARLNADGTLDQGFNPNPNARTSAIIFQPDANIVLAGAFTSLTPNGSTTTTTTTSTTVSSDVAGTTTTTANGTTTTTTITILSGITTKTVTVTTGTPVARNYLARVGGDGFVDQSYNPNPNASVNAMVRQADGKIVLGGAFTTLQPVQTTIKTAPTVSGDKAGTTTTTSNNTTTSVTVEISGNVTTTTTSVSNPPVTRNHMARLNADGSIDTNYNPDVNDSILALALNPDGKVIAGGAFTSMGPNGVGYVRNRMARLNPDGTMDTTFNPNITSAAVVDAIAVQADAKIVIGGTFTALQPNGATTATARNRVARLNFDGSLDGTFNPDANGPVAAVAVSPDGSIVLGGSFTALSPSSTLLIGGAFNSIGGTAAKNLALLGDDGAPNANFLPVPNGAVTALVAQPDGKFLVGGSFTTIAGASRNGLARFNADNTLDTAFNPAVSGGIGGVALQPDGKIVITGGFTSVGGQPRIALARLNADGSLDSGFNATGLIVAGSPTVQADGKIVVNGIAGGGQASLFRFNADGSRDNTFTAIAGTAPAGPTFTLQTDGRLVAAATTAGTLARFNATGAVDASFAPAVDNTVRALVVQPDGRIVIGGSFSTVGGLPRGSLARLGFTTPGIQALTATRTSVVLARSGGGPEISGVIFEQSSDLQTWTRLGSGGRVSGTSNWQLNGLTLPASGNVYLRARAIVPTGGGVSSGIMETMREFNFAATPGVGPATGLVATQDVGGVLVDAATGLTVGQSSPAMSATPIGVVAPSTILTDGFTDGTVRLTNFSARARVRAGGVLQTGFAISGAQPRTLLLRAAGPSLGAFGVNGALAQPRLQVLDAAGNLLRENSGWSASSANATEVSAAATRTGAFPFTSNSTADAAMVVTLNPGTYSMQVLDGSGAGGITLAEIYDAGADATGSKLVNLSIRGDVNPGEGAFLSGFVLTGNAARRMLVRGDGPSLTQFGVPGALADPVVSLFGNAGTLLASNDNWSTTTTGATATNAGTLAAAARSAGAFDLAPGSKDAALAATLVPGTYTVQVTSANTATGAALIEIYELP